MIESITFTRDIGPFRTGDTVSFESPITILVGENGSGKSTILNCLRVACGDKALRHEMSTRRDLDDAVEVNGSKSGKVVAWDFHLDDLTNAGYFDHQRDIAVQVSLSRLSAGQGTLLQIPDRLKAASSALLLLDEPGKGLSIRNQHNLRNMILNLYQKDNQLIVATHSLPILGLASTAVASIFNVETCETINSASEFVTRHLESIQKPYWGCKDII